MWAPARLGGRAAPPESRSLCPRASFTPNSRLLGARCGSPRPGESQVRARDPASAGPTPPHTPRSPSSQRLSPVPGASTISCLGTHTGFPSAHGSPLTASSQSEAQHPCGRCTPSPLARVLSRVSPSVPNIVYLDNSPSLSTKPLGDKAVFSPVCVPSTESSAWHDRPPERAGDQRPVPGRPGPAGRVC